MKKLSVSVKNTLLTIYESFIMLNLDYADIIYDKPFNESFQKANRNGSISCMFCY